ncbi:extracellular solute-binding protein (family 3) [Tamilnaduibacter salinus]|uniref:Extracellular solute-binding protein (Family 3) n=1 Tax=Tamilnaduibacter salinus TaxID=1484056 RepID=A0A2U1CYJ5_9GAMM|nr:extracellular solute-binding protein (family 3) [Tamilnaduibacter salinus]
MTFIVGLLIVLRSPFAAASPELIYCFSDRAMFPYNPPAEPNEQAPYPGIDIELLSRLQKRLPVSVTYRSQPWKRCLHQLGRNEVSAVIGSYRSSRESLGVYPRRADGTRNQKASVYSEDYVLYVRRGSGVHYNAETGKIVNLDGRPLGTLLGSSITEDLRASGNPVVTSSARLSTLFGRLERGRMGAVVALESHGNQLLRRFPDRFESIEQADTTLRHKRAYLILSHKFYRDHPELSAAIWRTLGELRRASLPDLYDKYYSPKRPANRNGPGF